MVTQLHRGGIPPERLEASARVLRHLGGTVDLRVYEGLGHSINRDDMEGLHELLDGVSGEGRGEVADGRFPARGGPLLPEGGSRDRKERG